MPEYKRPADFTEVLRSFADDEMDRARTDLNVSPCFPANVWDDPHFREAWYVGLWLGVRLRR